jgi:hypothetical protein
MFERTTIRSLSFGNFGLYSSTLSEALLDFVITQNLPFSVVDNPSFLNLLEIHKAGKKAQLPFRQAISGTVLSDAYITVRNIVKKEIEGSIKVSLTTDGWTGPRGIQYIVLTCHHLTPNFELKSAPIGFTSISGKHCTKNLTESIRRMLDEFGIPISKLAGITTDEGGAAPCIAEALREDLAEIHCACHLAQTALRNAFKQTTKEHTRLRDLVASASSFATAFQRRESFRKGFQACQVATQRTSPLVSPSDTRWNYMLHTIRSIVDNELPIRLWVVQQSQLPVSAREALAADMDDFTAGDWDTLNDLTKVLQLFETFTKVMQQDTRPTLHNLIPSYVRLTNSLNDLCPIIKSKEVNYFIEKVLEWLRVKFEPEAHGKFCWDDMEYLALVLNPMANVQDPHQSRLWDYGIELLRARVDSIQTQESVQIVNPQEAVPEAQDGRYLLKSRKKDDLNIVSSYLNLSERDPLPPEQFWPKYKDQLPQLYLLAVSTMSIPASQTTSERVFSLMKHILSDLRTRMKPETLQKLLIVKWHANHRNARIKASQTSQRLLIMQLRMH